MNNYPTDTLVDTDWLKQHLADANFRILDVRIDDPRYSNGYRMEHVRGAVALDVERDFFVHGNGKPSLAAPEQLAETFAQRGIARDTHIVIYDEWTGQAAAIAFWVLRYLGHRNIHILNGGWLAWRNADGTVTRDIPQIAPAQFRIDLDESTRATAEWIEANAARDDVLLLDARSPGEFQMGHISGAVNLPFEFSLELKTQRFKNAENLRAELEATGITPDKEIAVYCHTGARSSHMYTTLRLMGYPRVRNYNGSMADWHERRGLPIEY
jgi:thiosulfate/3-mercaptopyruvate sulfurtransferase